MAGAARATAILRSPKHLLGAVERGFAVSQLVSLAREPSIPQPARAHASDCRYVGVSVTDRERASGDRSRRLGQFGGRLAE